MSKLKKLNIVNYISENETTFNIELTYEIFGKPIGEAPIVLVNHALTGNSRITGLGGWWSSIIGNDKLIDTADFTVIAFNFPGNGYDGFLIRNYEDLILRDVAKIFIIGLKKLNIKKLFAVIGGSIGGGLVWEMAAISPNLAENYIPYSWSPASTALKGLILSFRVLEPTTSASQTVFLTFHLSRVTSQMSSALQRRS